MSGTPVPGPVVEKVEHEPAAAVPEDDENEPTTAAQDNDLATEVDAPAAPAEIQALDEPEAIDADHAQSVLEQTLDALGSAHHRPFSRG